MNVLTPFKCKFMKKNLKRLAFYESAFRKPLLVMRCSLFLFFISVFQAQAISGFAQKSEFSFSFKNASVSTVLGKIEDESNFYFMCNRKLVDLDRMISIQVENQPLEKVLTEIFMGTDVEYVITGKQIVLTPRRNNSQANQVARQPLTISGRVTDSTGLPLPGVSVLVKGTTNGTTTDLNGNYSLSNIPENAVLQFSFLGMKVHEIPVSGKSTINVTMTEATIGIKEVVVIGYGTAKKSDLTGSISTIQGDALSEKRTLRVSEALQGAAPGVMVTRSGGPGTSANIKIRGITTIGNSEPLTIIDGVPGNIDRVNPDDIASISVLKDAASASIYGSRAASGVILITTKRSKEGQIRLRYNVEYGVKQPTRLRELLGAVPLMKLRNEYAWNDTDYKGSEYSLYSQNLIENYPSLHAENPDLYPDTDWQKIMLNDYAPREGHSLTLTVGSKNIGTNISINYEKDDAIYDHRSFSRYSVRANNDITINKYLAADVDLSYNRSLDERPITDIPIRIADGSLAAGNVSATAPAVWTNGLIANGNPVGNNPYALLQHGGFNNNWNNSFVGKLSLDFTPLKELKFSAVLSPTFGFSKRKTFQKEIRFTNWDNPNIYIGSVAGAVETSLRELKGDTYDITTQFFTNYSKTLGKHDLNLMAGYENYYYFNESIGASSRKYALKSYPYLDLGNPNYLSNSGDAYETAYRSFFGRAMYSFKNRYLVQANVRYDGSSRFHEDYRWGMFPSFSLGWILTEEPFMRNVPGLSFLKIRSSWGMLGNERIGNYPYQSNLIFDNTVIYQGQDIVSAQGAVVRKYPIKDITWETTETYNLGMDVNFFNNKLSLTGDYYKKTTRDMLLPLDIPDFMGFTNPDQNTGKMFTKGWDVELGYHNTLGKLNYSVSANLSDFKSVMGDLGGTQFFGEQVKFEGSEFNEWYGYKSDGLYQNQEEVNTLPKMNPSVRIGDIKYIDISGPNGIPDGKISPEYDRVLQGGSLPRYLYGGNIQAGYKNFNFSVAFQGIGKQTKKITQDMIGGVGGEATGDIPSFVLGKYWSKYNSDEQNRQATYPRYTRNSVANNVAASDFWFFHGGYFRLKNISIGYTIPESLGKKLRLQNARLYTTATDPFSIDNYPPGWDPETFSGSYWMMKSFVFGLSVDF